MTSLTVDRILPFQSIEVGRTTLIPAQTVLLPNPLVYSNAHICGQPWFRTYRAGSVAAREARTPEVALGMFPSATVLLGPTYWTLSDGALNADAIHPGFTDIVPAMEWVAGQTAGTIDVDFPSLLLARWGQVTWGHWACEILPKVAVCERFFPGRFRYVLARDFMEVRSEGDYASTIRQSMACYGVGPDRYFCIDPQHNYRFSQLFDVSGIRHLHLMNPGLLQIISDDARAQEDVAFSKRIAIMRRDAVTRNMENSPAIESYIEGLGFQLLTMAEMPFAARVAAARSCEVMFSIWGSGFSYLMYAPAHVGVVSVGPTDWPDDYFTGLVQQRDSVFVDLRGPSLWDGEGVVRDAPFFIDQRQLEKGMNILTGHLEGKASGRLIDVLGELVSRRVAPPDLVIDFSAGGNAVEFLGEGWSFEEHGSRWAIGARSTIAIPSILLDGDYDVLLEGWVTNQAPYLETHKLSVSANGIFLKSFAISDQNRCVFQLERGHYANTEQVIIEFSHPISPSPFSLGMSDDCRALGICVMSIAFYPLGRDFEAVPDGSATLPVLARGTGRPDDGLEITVSAESRGILSDIAARVAAPDLAIDFSSTGNAAAFLGEGWSSQEGTFCWSLGEQSTLAIPSGSLRGDYHVVLTCMALTLPSPHTLSVFVGATLLGSFLLGIRNSCAFRLEHRHYSDLDNFELRFFHPLSVSPRALGINEDPRELGIGVFSVAFYRVPSEATPSPQLAAVKR